MKLFYTVKIVLYIITITIFLIMSVLNFISCNYLSGVCNILCAIVWIVVCMLFINGIKRNS